MVKEDLRNLSAHVLGIVSLILAFIIPFPALIIGIVGLVHSIRQKNAISKKLNILAIIFSIVMIVLGFLINLEIITIPGLLY